jgi:ABC-2 type transport system permease protein
MRGAWTICRRELMSYFASPIAYAVMALYALIFGYFFYVGVRFFTSPMLQQQSMGRPLNIHEMIVSPLVMNAAVTMMFLLPMLTMRVFAEDKRQGTIELLVTSPVSDVAIVVGKWLASWLLYASILGVAGLSLMLLFAWGAPDWKPMAIAYLGLLLMGAGFLAIGTFLSSLTKNQIIAGVAGFCFLILMWVVSWMGQLDSGGFSSFMSKLSMLTHLESFSRGVIDTKDLAYFLSMTFLGLFLAVRSIESMRWRA